jgi:hypothetical protein
MVILGGSFLCPKRKRGGGVKFEIANNPYLPIREIAVFACSSVLAFHDDPVTNQITLLVSTCPKGLIMATQAAKPWERGWGNSLTVVN